MTDVMFKKERYKLQPTVNILVVTLSMVLTKLEFPRKINQSVFRNKIDQDIFDVILWLNACLLRALESKSYPNLQF